MARRWYSYIDYQKYSDCQLITALNAYYYLTGRIYAKYGSDEYERLVDKCGARHGSAISIEKVHKELGIKATTGYLSLHGALLDDPSNLYRKDGTTFHKKSKPFIIGDIKKIGKPNLPLEACVWHRRTGFHSCLIVDYNKKVNAVRVANFKEVTHSGWVFCDDLDNKYIGKITSGGHAINGDGQQWHYRKFKIRNKSFVPLGKDYCELKKKKRR